MAGNSNKKKYLCGTEPWISADITEKEYRAWLKSIYDMKPVNSKGNKKEVGND